MRYLPVFIDTSVVSVLVIGGGAAAEAKLRTLIKTEAELVLIAPHVSAEIRHWVNEGRIRWQVRQYRDADLAGRSLIYICSDNRALNRKAVQAARALNIPYNTADDCRNCSFISPALVDRSPVVVAIGSEGTAPGLIRVIKTDLENFLPKNLGRLAEFIGQVRRKVSLPHGFWTRVLSGYQGRSLEQVQKTIETEISGRKTVQGRVALVGAGPGDPELMTLQARNRLSSADVIVYDRLVSKDVLDLGRREAQYVYAGKTPGKASISQSDINALLIEKAKTGLFVVRLKSGDPLVFGRADEEINALEAAGVHYEICPGITAASAAAASASVSLTTRGHNKAVSFLTGHDAKGFAEHDWANLAETGTRAAIYMGVGAVRFIQGRLFLHGAQPDTPVTIVEKASRADEQIISARLDTLPDAIKANHIKGPAILLLGYESQAAVNSERLEMVS